MCLIRIINWNRLLIKTAFVIFFLTILDNTEGLRANRSYVDGVGDRYLRRPTFEKLVNPVYNNAVKSSSTSVAPLESKASGSGRDLGLIILGYAAKFCLYAFSYFKLICLCMFVSALFLLLCPLLPFIIPALLLLLVVAVAMSITIPIAAVAGTAGGGGGDGSLTVISQGPGGGPPNFVSIPA